MRYVLHISVVAGVVLVGAGACALIVWRSAHPSVDVEAVLRSTQDAPSGVLEGFGAGRSDMYFADLVPFLARSGGSIELIRYVDGSFVEQTAGGLQLRRPEPAAPVAPNPLPPYPESVAYTLPAERHAASRSVLAVDAAGGALRRSAMADWEGGLDIRPAASPTGSVAVMVSPRSGSLLWEGKEKQTTLPFVVTVVANDEAGLVVVVSTLERRAGGASMQGFDGPEGRTLLRGPKVVQVFDAKSGVEVSPAALLRGAFLEDKGDWSIVFSPRAGRAYLRQGRTVWFVQPTSTN